MSEVKHTPGPWSPEPFVRAEGSESWGIFSDYLEPGYTGGAGGTWILLDSTTGYVEANAQLIAAAPDLLEACEALLHTEWNKKPGSLDEFEIRADVLEQARAAIAKAKAVER